MKRRFPTPAGRRAPDRWVVGLNAVVVDNNDPDGMHRIKVVIPSIDEDIIHDEWVRALVPWVGPDGYGPVHPPEAGSEVVLFGCLGEKHSLFYTSVFDEQHRVPFDDARGLKTDTLLRFLADQLIEIISGQSVLVKGADQVNVQAPVVRLLGGNSEGVRVEPNKFSVLGAAPASRQSLPGDANDLATCIALCNALKHMVAIKFGFAE